MAVTNPEALKFVKEQVRVLAEYFRADAVRSDAANAQWFGGINNLIPNDSTPIDDGRENEGVSRLTGQDIHNFMGQVAAVAGLNEEIVQKPCVRPINVTVSQ